MPVAIEDPQILPFVILQSVMLNDNIGSSGGVGGSRNDADIDDEERKKSLSEIATNNIVTIGNTYTLNNNRTFALCFFSKIITSDEFDALF